LLDDYFKDDGKPKNKNILWYSGELFEVFCSIAVIVGIGNMDNELVLFVIWFCADRDRVDSFKGDFSLFRLLLEVVERAL
jgi:hypothetical protein